MDKRWIAILVILIIGVSCMVYVVSTSNTVGSAISDVNKSTITLPDGFSKGDSTSGSIFLVNKQSDEKIYMEDLGKSDISKEKFTKKSNSISSTDINITNLTDTTVYTIYYLDEPGFNNSISYFYSCQHTFYMKMTGYDNIKDMNEDINFIVTTIQPDYKQTQ